MDVLVDKITILGVTPELAEFCKYVKFRKEFTDEQKMDKAYRHLQRVVHPDKNGEAMATHKFQTLQALGEKIKHADFEKIDMEEIVKSATEQQLLVEEVKKLKEEAEMMKRQWAQKEDLHEEVLSDLKLKFEETIEKMEIEHEESTKKVNDAWIRSVKAQVEKLKLRHSEEMKRMSDRMLSMQHRGKIRANKFCKKKIQEAESRSVQCHKYRKRCIETCEKFCDYLDHHACEGCRKKVAEVRKAIIKQ
jgi:hypothetical protein